VRHVSQQAHGGLLPTLALAAEGWLMEWWVLKAPFHLPVASGNGEWSAAVQAVFLCDVSGPGVVLGSGVAFCSASETGIDPERGRRLALDRALKQAASPFTRAMRLEVWRHFEGHFGEQGR
jgi:hypothetical protein